MNDKKMSDLVISLLPGLKYVDKIKLLKIFNNEEELYLRSKRDIEIIINHELKNDWDINEIRATADSIDKICNMRSIKWVSWTDAGYPPLLREMYDPPAVIFYRGILPNPEKSLLGMVGTRKPSPEAAMQAFTLACGAGKAGISVVSGLAIGIDSMAHRGNLFGGVPGYAVLGSGVDEIYPSSNRPLAKKILDQGGALISEYPPGTKPFKWNFPARNRIISALSRSVLVVEAPEKSGSLITADLALQQGKDIWAASSGIIPQGALHDRRGTMKLVEDGAEIIYSEKDIFDKWNMDIADNVENVMVLSGKACVRDIVSSMSNFLKIEV